MIDFNAIYPSSKFAVRVKGGSPSNPISRASGAILTDVRVNWENDQKMTIFRSHDHIRQIPGHRKFWHRKWLSLSFFDQFLDNIQAYLREILEIKSSFFFILVKKRRGQSFSVPGFSVTRIFSDGITRSKNCHFLIVFLSYTSICQNRSFFGIFDRSQHMFFEKNDHFFTSIWAKRSKKRLFEQNVRLFCGNENFSSFFTFL